MINVWIKKRKKTNKWHHQSTEPHERSSVSGWHTPADTSTEGGRNYDRWAGCC